MAAVRPLGEYVQTSSELTDLACNAIHVLFSNIRTCPDQVAACATSSGVSTFDSFDTTNTDPMAGTIIQGKSALRLPGPQKRTRIVGQGERLKNNNNINQQDDTLSVQDLLWEHVHNSFLSSLGKFWSDC